MKKILSIILSLALCVTAASFCTASVSADAAQSLLPNVYAKMKNNEKIHIGYFGGSVTNGYGATSQSEKSWRYYSRVWLADYAQSIGSTSSIYEGTHAGLGGTGTDLNVYRADSALDLDGSDPVDLLFIEFAINDSYEGNTYDKSAYYMESIVRKVWEKDPECDIVICITTDFGKASHDQSAFVNATAHKDVAAYYGIPVFDFGAHMWEFLKEENGGTPVPAQTDPLWTYYYADGCHPNDNGYLKYAEFLWDDFLEEAVDDTKGYSTTVVNHTMPEATFSTRLSAPYNIAPRTDAYLVNAGEARNLSKAYNFAGSSTLSANGGGASFKAIFHSKSAGMYYTGNPDNGLVLYSVDGGEYKAMNLYSSSNNTNEYFMFYDNLAYGEHTVDVIFRKTEHGASLALRSFFIDGDPDKFGVEFGDAPNTKPLSDIYYSSVVLTPALLDTTIQGGGTVNDSAVRTQLHHHSDVDVLQYAPNTSSTNNIASDCYNSTLRTVSVPLYKYAVIHYYYDLPTGVTSHADSSQVINFLQLKVDGVNRSLFMHSADPLVANQTASSIFDLTAIPVQKEYEGTLMQMHVYPFGDRKANQVDGRELMNIQDITFYVDYPYDASPVTVTSGMTASSSAVALDLTGKKLLPSAFKYATVNYSNNTATGVKLGVDVKYPSASYKYFTKDISGESGSVILNLSEAATSGQTDYYTEALVSAVGGSFTVDSVVFSTEYPDKTVKFDVTFDANGGSGTVPAPVKGSIDSLIELPSPALTKPGCIFIGWNTDRNAAAALSQFYVPEDGAVLYAIYAQLATVYASASGSLVYEGETHTAYTTLAEAVTSLGASGGTVIFNGRYDWPENSFNENAPIVVLKGAYSTAQIVTPQTTRIKCNTTFENLSFIKSRKTDGTENDVYFNFGGKKVTVGTEGQDDVKIFSENTSTGALTEAEFKIYGSSTGSSPDITINSGKIGIFCADGYNTTTNGNTKVTVNGGTIGSGGVVAGLLGFNGSSSPQNKTHHGNVTVTVNGGTFNNKNIKVSYNDNNKTTVSGAATVILNNGMASQGLVVSSDFNYIVKAAAGGKADVYAEADGGAPAFIVTCDDPEKFVFVNGEQLDTVNGVATFTPTATGTYDVSYGMAARTLSFNANGGSGSAPSPMTVPGGGSVTLPGAGSMTKAGFSLLGWSLTSTSQSLVSNPFTMPNADTVLYAVWAESGVAFVNGDNSGILTVDGADHTAYADLTSAINALGTDGGVIYFTGDQAFTQLSGIVNGTKELTFIGVDGARFTEFNDNYTLKCPLAFENITFLKGYNKYPHLWAAGYKVTIGEGVEVKVYGSDGVSLSNSKFEYVLGNSGTRRAEIVINSATNDSVVPAYSSSFTGDFYVTLNGGTANLTNVGIRSPGASTFLNGNVTVTVNGGTISGNSIIATNFVEGSGARTLIFNNGTYRDLTTDFDYIFNSEAGGTVSLETPATSSAAPVLRITADDSTVGILVDGSVIGTGSATFTPTEKKIYVVTYATIKYTVSFDANGGTGSVPESISAIPGAVITLPAPTGLTRDGFLFRGWGTSADAAKTISAYTIGSSDATIYALWVNASKVCANADGSGILTIDGTDYFAFDTIAEAIAALGTAGGTVYFEGTHTLKSVVDAAAAAHCASLVVHGMSDNSILLHKGETITCDTAFENLKFRVDPDSSNDYPYLWSGNHVLTVGNVNDTVLIERIMKNGSKTGVEILGGGANAKIILNSGNFSSNVGTVNWSGSASYNAIMEVNGGTSISASAMAPFYSSGSVLNGNLCYTFNGGQFANTAFNVTKNTTINGNIIAIFNNGLADTYDFTTDCFEYVLEASADVNVKASSLGNNSTAPVFELTPASEGDVLVNGEALAMTGDKYLFTPAEMGTYVITLGTAEAGTSTFTFATARDSDGSVVVDDKTGYDGRAILILDDDTSNAIFVEEAGVNGTVVSAELSLSAGTHSYILVKNGYKPASGTLTVAADGSFTDPEIALVPGDIKGSFEEVCGDGKIDVNDFIRVVRGFAAEASTALREAVDINEDGIVTVADLALVKANFGE